MKQLFVRSAPAVFFKNKFKNQRLTLVAVSILVLIFTVATTAMAESEYDASDVDKLPKIVRSTPIKYPSQAKKDGITGMVMIRCLIGTDGKVSKMEVVESKPAGVFDESALSTIKYWQFRPGIRKGEMVATWVKVPIKFE